MKALPILFLFALIIRETSGDVFASTICGNDDGRTPSEDVKVGRIVTSVGNGTAWLMNEKVFFTAGHNFNGTPDENTRVHFTFNEMDAPEEDQYVVDFYRSFVDGAIDWAVGRLFPNNMTGMFPGEAQSKKCKTPTPGCGWFNLSKSVPSAGGHEVAITGYSKSNSQSTSTGSLFNISQLNTSNIALDVLAVLAYDVDTEVRLSRIRIGFYALATFTTPAYRL